MAWRGGADHGAGDGSSTTEAPPAAASGRLRASLRVTLMYRSCPGDGRGEGGRSFLAQLADGVGGSGGDHAQPIGQLDVFVLLVFFHIQALVEESQRLAGVDAQRLVDAVADQFAMGYAFGPDPAVELDVLCASEHVHLGAGNGLQ